MGTAVAFDPSEHTVDEVVDHLRAHPEDAELVLAAERDGKDRKGVLEAAGPFAATTTLREDYLGRDVVDPTGTAKDWLGRETTSTADFLGRPHQRALRANSTAVAQGALLQFAAGAKFVVKTAGTTAGSAPAAPAVGADVTDGTAVLTRTL